MDGYKNKFDIAEGLEKAPLQTIKAIRKDPTYKKDKILMRLIKMMIDGFKKWMHIESISAVKGALLPIGQKNAVDPGYYDYKKTEEFKSMRNMVADHIGVSQDYFSPDKLEKYHVIKEMIMNGEDPKSIESLELTAEGFFYNADTGKVYDVLSAKDMDKLEKYILDNPDKFGEGSKHTKIYEFGDKTVVDASEPVVRAFLEKLYLGRDPKSREKGKEQDKEPAQSSAAEKQQNVIEQGDFLFELREDGTAFIKAYTGNDKDSYSFLATNPPKKIKTPMLPNEIKIDDRIYPVKDISEDAFLYCPLEKLPYVIYYDAQYWENNNFNKAFFSSVIGGPINSKPINLSPEIKKQINDEKAKRAVERELRGKQPITDKQKVYLEGLIQEKLVPAGYTITPDDVEKLSVRRADYIIQTLKRDISTDKILEYMHKNFGDLLDKVKDPEIEQEKEIEIEETEPTKHKSRGMDR